MSVGRSVGCQNVCLSARLSVGQLAVSLSVCTSVGQSVGCQCVCLSARLSVGQLAVSLSVCMSVGRLVGCQYVCLSVISQSVCLSVCRPLVGHLAVSWQSVCLYSLSVRRSVDRLLLMVTELGYFLWLLLACWCIWGTG